MNWAIKGMVLGGIVGMAASAMIINRIEPSLGKMMMRRGRNMVRRYRRRIAGGLF